MVNDYSSSDVEVIGLIPAAGRATRISPLPTSKEIYPVGFRTCQDGSIRPKVICHYLLENIRRAGIRKTYFLLRDGKWDVPAYFGDGDMVDMDLGYLMVRRLYGVPYSIDQAYEFVKHAIVAVGFPDMIIEPEDAYKRLLSHLRSSNADVVINAVPFPDPSKGGMLSFNDDGSVSHIIEKPKDSDAKYSWSNAVWKPSFTEFLHQYLIEIEADIEHVQQRREIPLGDLIQVAIDRGLRVEAVIMEDGGYLDIGTPEDLMKAVRNLSRAEL